MASRIEQMRHELNADKSVMSLLDDQEAGGHDGENGGPVVKGISKVWHAIDTPDLDYGSRVRVLTKALMMVNEEHRQGKLF